MTTTKLTFRSDVEAIYIPRLGRAITFKDGSYSTDDPAEIQVLSGHEDVTEDAPANADKSKPKDAPAKG